MIIDYVDCAIFKKDIIVILWIPKTYVQTVIVSAAYPPGWLESLTILL